MLSFRMYIETCQARDNATGDFVRDARRDRTFPDAQTWRELKDYLLCKGACYDAIDAGQAVWNNFKRKYRNVKT